LRRYRQSAEFSEDGVGWFGLGEWFCGLVVLSDVLADGVFEVGERFEDAKTQRG
jgi:hypothetical protein